MNDETPRVRSFEDADEQRELEHGRVDLIRLGGVAFDRATFERAGAGPSTRGWREAVERHLGYQTAGAMRFRMDEGTELDARAGDVHLVPAGHDAWVVGDGPCVAVDLGLSG